jgi:hypothetical protein
VLVAMTWMDDEKTTRYFSEITIYPLSLFKEKSTSFLYNIKLSIIIVYFLGRLFEGLD